MSEICSFAFLRSDKLTLRNHGLYRETMAWLHNTHSFVFWKKKKNKQNSGSTMPSDFSS
jgi:hypothetical protein